MLFSYTNFFYNFLFFKGVHVRSICCRAEQELSVSERIFGRKFIWQLHFLSPSLTGYSNKASSFFNLLFHPFKVKKEWWCNEKAFILLGCVSLADLWHKSINPWVLPCCRLNFLGWGWWYRIPGYPHTYRCGRGRTMTRSRCLGLRNSDSLPTSSSLAKIAVWDFFFFFKENR